MTVVFLWTLFNLQSFIYHLLLRWPGCLDPHALAVVQGLLLLAVPGIAVPGIAVLGVLLVRI